MLAESGSRQLPLVSPGQGTVVMAWKWEGVDARKPFWLHPGPRSSRVWADCASQSLAAPGDQGLSSTPESRRRLAGQRAWLMGSTKKAGNKKPWGKQGLEVGVPWMGDPRPCRNSHTSLLPQPFPHGPGMCWCSRKPEGKRISQSRKENGNEITRDFHSFSVLARSWGTERQGKQQGGGYR